MPDWLVDHPTLLDILLIVVSMVLGALWWRTRRGKYLLGAGGALLALAVLWLLGLFLPSDARKIEQALQEMSAGVAAHDPGRIFQHVSDEFSQGPPTFGSTLNKAGFRQRSEAILNARNVTEVRIWDVAVEELSRERKQARVSFMVKPKGNWTNEGFFRVEADFVLDPDGKWRMRGFRVFNPAVQSREAIQIPGG